MPKDCILCDGLDCRSYQVYEEYAWTLKQRPTSPVEIDAQLFRINLLMDHYGQLDVDAKTFNAHFFDRDTESHPIRLD